MTVFLISILAPEWSPVIDHVELKEGERGSSLVGGNQVIIRKTWLWTIMWDMYGKC